MVGVGIKIQRDNEEELKKDKLEKKKIQWVTSDTGFGSSEHLKNWLWLFGRIQISGILLHCYNYIQQP